MIHSTRNLIPAAMVALAQLGLRTLALASVVAPAFAQQWHSGAPIAPHAPNIGRTVVSVEDFDQSGHPDIVRFDSAGVYIIKDPDLTTSLPPETLLWSIPGVFTAAIHAGDIDNDGIPDLMIRGPFFSPAPRDYYFVRGLGGGQLAAPVTLPSSTESRGPLRFARMLDFDGDGDLDLVAFHDDGANLTELIAWRQDPGGFVIAHSEAIGIADEAGSGDFNGDGCDDLICYAGWPVHQHRVLWGDPIALSQTVQPGVSLHWSLKGFVSEADFNGDGFEDIVATGARGRVEVFYGSATGIQRGPLLVDDILAGGHYHLVLEDLDNDGNVDLLMRAQAGGLLYRGDGSGAFSAAPRVLPFGLQGQLMPMDLDGDSDQDLLVVEFRAITGFENRTLYGAPCLGTAGEAQLTHGVATPGNSAFYVDLTNGPANAPAQLVIAFDGAPAPCGAQFNPATLLWPTFGLPLFATALDGGGNVRLPLPLPSGIALGPYYLQGLVIDPNGAFQLPGLNLAATRGRVIEIF
ncbi:MAG: VCBS repeat-containing protein [bacterium]|nr:VCBS repeat-containing protein [bacterium]